MYEEEPKILDLERKAALLPRPRLRQALTSQSALTRVRRGRGRGGREWRGGRRGAHPVPHAHRRPQHLPVGRAPSLNTFWGSQYPQSFGLRIYLLLKVNTCIDKSCRLRVTKGALTVGSQNCSFKRNVWAQVFVVGRLVVYLLRRSGGRAGGPRPGVGPARAARICAAPQSEGLYGCKLPGASPAHAAAAAPARPPKVRGRGGREGRGGHCPSNAGGAAPRSRRRPRGRPSTAGVGAGLRARARCTHVVTPSLSMCLSITMHSVCILPRI